MDLGYRFRVVKFPPTLDLTLKFFNEHYLNNKELLHFVEILNRFQTVYGSKACWCLKSVTKAEVKGFTTSHTSKPLYKGIDARPLALAVVDQYQDWTKPVVVRRHQCGSLHCINPNHYYYGTKRDVCFERGWRKGSPITPELVAELREKHESQSLSFATLAETHKLPYYLVRNICRYVAYE